MRKRFSVQLETLRTTIRLLYRTNPRAFTVSAIASLTEPLFYPALVILLQQLFTRIASSGGIIQINSDVLPIGFALIAILLIQRIGIIVRDASSTILRQEAWVVISKQIMQKLPTVPYSLFEDNNFQARYGLVVREASYRSISLVDTILSTAPILLGLIGLAVTLFVIAPLMVIILLVIAIPAGRIEQKFSGEMYDLQERTAPHKLRLEALTNMQIDAIWQRDVRIYSSDLLRREHEVLAESFLAQLKTLTGRFFRLRSGAALVQVAGMGLALAAVFILLQQGQLSVANLAVLLPGTSILTGMISAFIWQFRSLLESLAYARTLSEFLATSFEDEKKNPSPVGSRPSQLSAIRLTKVSYTYPQQDRIALTDVSYAFTPGLTAIVGTNGAGKTTLVKLVSGLIEPTSGEIEAVGTDGKTFALSDIVKAVLFQDPGHFPFSIRHNITMQFDQTPQEDERIIEALRSAGLWETVQGLPDGIDTIVGAGFGGVTDLSGGQWQRLALARLLYHDAPIIILDEPSASLDPVGERQIFALLSTLAQKKIILFTTHRYDTIRKAETIMVLVDGKIAEVGNHDELERKAGAFWSLYFGQAVVSK